MLLVSKPEKQTTSKTWKQFTVSYRKANTIDSDDNVDIPPRIPPRPLSTYIPNEMAGYTLPNTSRQSHIIHPTSSLNRLRSEIDNEVNPAIKYFTMERESQNQSEECPTAPCAKSMNKTDLDLDFYNTPMELLKTTNGDNDWKQPKKNSNQWWSCIFVKTENKWILFWCIFQCMPLRQYSSTQLPIYKWCYPWK